MCFEEEIFHAIWAQFKQEQEDRALSDMRAYLHWHRYAKTAEKHFNELLNQLRLHPMPPSQMERARLNRDEGGSSAIERPWWARFWQREASPGHWVRSLCLASDFHQAMKTARVDAERGIRTLLAHPLGAFMAWEKHRSAVEALAHQKACYVLRLSSTLARMDQWTTSGLEAVMQDFLHFLRFARHHEVEVLLDVEEPASVPMQMMLVLRALGDPVTQDWSGFGVSLSSSQRWSMHWLKTLIQQARKLGRRIALRVSDQGRTENAYSFQDRRACQLLWSDPQSDHMAFLHLACVMKEASDVLSVQLMTHDIMLLAELWALMRYEVRYELHHFYGMAQPWFVALMQLTGGALSLAQQAMVGPISEIERDLWQQWVSVKAHHQELRWRLDPRQDWVWHESWMQATSEALPQDWSWNQPQSVDLSMRSPQALQGLSARAAYLQALLRHLQSHRGSLIQQWALQQNRSLDQAMLECAWLLKIMESYIKQAHNLGDQDLKGSWLIQGEGLEALGPWLGVWLLGQHAVLPDSLAAWPSLWGLHLHPEHGSVWGGIYDGTSKTWGPGMLHWVMAHQPCLFYADGSLDFEIWAQDVLSAARYDAKRCFLRLEGRARDWVERLDKQRAEQYRHFPEPGVWQWQMFEGTDWDHMQVICYAKSQPQDQVILPGARLLDRLFQPKVPSLTFLSSGMETGLL